MDKQQIQKTFIPGSEWLYYKVYCGVKTADDILIDIIKPLTEELLKEQLIDQWFFIRYSDPETHLRIRFHIPNQKNLTPILIKIKEHLFPLVQTNQIWDLQLASYQRELKRYGNNTIEIAESFFYYDSMQIISIIKNSENDEVCFCKIFAWIECLLSLFISKIEDQLLFLKKNEQLFKKEFNIAKPLKIELSNKYKRIEELVNNEVFISKKEVQAIANELLTLQQENQLEIQLESVLSSFIHMSINRGFRSKQRFYEMLLYDFLYRKIKSKKAKDVYK